MQTIQHLITQLRQSRASDQLYEEIIRTIRNQELLWAAFSPVTSNYYTGMEHGEYTAYLFSEKTFAEKFQEDMLQKNIDITIAENKAANRLLLLGDLMRTGITNILIDSGQPYVAVGIFDLLSELDGYEPEHKERIVMNPQLLGPAHYFYQKAAAGNADTNDTLPMLRILSRAKFIVPMRDDALMALRNEDGTAYLMLFTDWPELRRYDKNPDCPYEILTYQEVREAAKNLSGIFINPQGANMLLDNQMLAAVDAAANGTLQVPAQNITMRDSSSIRISAVPEDAQELLDTAAEFLKEKKNVNAAYMRIMEKDTEIRPSYLLILDGTSLSKEMNAEIAAKLMPLTKGLDLEITSTQDEFGRTAAEKTKPFYKKRKFLFFGA